MELSVLKSIKSYEEKRRVAQQHATFAQKDELPSDTQHSQMKDELTATRSFHTKRQVAQRHIALAR